MHESTPSSRRNVVVRVVVGVVGVVCLAAILLVQPGHDAVRPDGTRVSSPWVLSNGDLVEVSYAVDPVGSGDGGASRHVGRGVHLSGRV
ncbi:hypothetical protein ACNHYB_08085 [Isoptericola jiangsuensis]|uniref:hypothetical protein n=1 Tax=Isoptericola jiangsuensis TaxID=548579 RepID=UPI003AAB5B3D